MKVRILLTAVWLIVGAGTAFAQTTSFTYQGRLTDGGTLANGNYDLQFALWDSLSGGAQVGSTQTLNTVTVSNGVFTVSLDFGANAFTGASRFLEISARLSTGGSFTLLTPRQQITSTPYAVRSLNASSADSVPATGIPSGSGNYIQNTSSLQSSSNFNISGNGTAGGTLSGNVVNATTQFNLNGSRILSNPGLNNLFAGAGAGAANTTGTFNAFFAQRAGEANKDGAFNSFFGGLAGLRNTTGFSNSFFGLNAGLANTIGSGNTFIGAGAGFSNTAGDNNTIIGANADVIPGPIFNPTNATAIGYNARVTDSNAIVLGSINGVNGGPDTNVGIGTTAPKQKLHVRGQGLFTADAATFDPGDGVGPAIRIGFDSNGGYGYINANNTGVTAKNLVLQPNNSQGNVGIGTTAPTARLSVIATGDGARVLHLGTERAWVFRQLGTGAASALELTGDDPNNNNKNFVINTQGNVGIGTTAPDQKLSVNGNASKTGGGSWATFSDERLKDIKGRFTPGLRAVMQLQPLRYEYKRDNALALESDGEHVGFSAQAVQKVIPEAVTTNSKGYLLVNNDPILWTMLNSIKEQQAQIQQQRELIERQQALAARQQQQLNALKKLACRSHRRASLCR